MEMERQNKKMQVWNLLAEKIRKLVEESVSNPEELQEIRIRTGQPLLIQMKGQERVLPDPVHPYLVTKEDIGETMGYICHYSLYAYENELKQGFITVEGGHRVGVAGKVIIENEKVKLYDDLKGYEPLYVVAERPTVRFYEDNLYLKFLIKLKATDTEGNQSKCRYPIIVIIYSKSDIIEVRFDSMGSMYYRDKFRYVYETIAWLRNNLETNIKLLDLRDVAYFIRENGKDNRVVLAAQDMRMANGGKATVDVGNDDTNVLPFIGELKVLLEEYKEEFDKAPIIKDALEEFIYNKENLSDFPWIKFRFEDRDIEVKITFDYGKRKISLLQHYQSQLVKNVGKERMDYVTSYLLKVRNNIKELSDNNEGNK